MHFNNMLLTVLKSPPMLTLYIACIYAFIKYRINFFLGDILPIIRTGKICQNQLKSLIVLSPGIAKLWLGKFVLTSDITLIERILKHPNAEKPSHSYRIFPRIIGYRGSGDFISARRSCSFYAKNRTKVYQSLMNTVVHRFEEIFKPSITQHLVNLNGEYRVSELTHKIATSAITEVGFGIHDANFDKSLFETIQWLMLDAIKRPENIGVWFLDYIPTPTNVKLWRYQKQLYNTIKELIQEKRAEYPVEHPAEHPVKYPDVITTLILHNTDDEIIGIVAPLFLAGFDTTANAMGMAIHFLSLRPDLQQKIQQERMTINSSNIEEMQKLTLLSACIFETLRLFPSVPMISREANMPGCPFAQPGGAFGINVNLFKAFRDPEWESPNEFIPERWLTNTKKPLYCPFSVGKRSCLGKHFALLEMLVTLSELFLRYHVKPSSDNPPPPSNFESGTLNMDPEFTVVLTPTGYSGDNTPRVKVPPERCLVTLRGKHYDVTNYLPLHPGGEAILRAYSGSDITMEFESIHLTSTAKNILQKYLIL